MIDPSVTKYMSSLGKRSAAKLTPEQRSERARKAGSMKGKKTGDNLKPAL